MGRRGHHTRATALLGALLLAGCIPVFGPPPVLSDPANFAAEPWRHRGDRLDRNALALLQRWGADYGTRPEEAPDEQVVRETLRVVPPRARRPRRGRPPDHSARGTDGGRVRALKRRNSAAPQT